MEENKILSVNEELEILIRARYPLVYILSFEEKRIENFLINIAKQRNKKIFAWTITTGIVNLSSASMHQSNDSTRDPEAALEYINHGPDLALYILKDFHPYLSVPPVVRKLKDLTVSFRTSYKTLILISSFDNSLYGISPVNISHNTIPNE